ncbi:ScyD/ScyE family protein [Mycetocola sp. 2940]|uniref:ScyD/ScyE family protein n=1 Tax=Mycetocola sp. 2940 TaxID=3156452 RepID=UPI0033924332
MKVHTLTAAVCAAVLTTVALATPASARGQYPPIGVDHQVLADGMMAPLSLDVQPNGTAWITQNFPGVLTKVTAKGEQVDVLTGNGDEISAVTTRGNTVYYAQVSADATHSRSVLMSVTEGSAPVQVADLRAHEDQENPDAVNTYGFVDLPESCASQFEPAAEPFLQPTYAGAIDTHPYASLATKDGIYVADAGMNAILKVGYDGDVSTVAVLPPTEPVVTTAEVIALYGFPECAIGYSYRFEPVPTDVEIGPGGWLYVTTLPGGPEDPSLGERGAVYRVDPSTGDVELFATGFVGSTGLAVSKKGVVFVAEMFGGADGTGQVSVIPPWGGEAVAEFPVSSPAAIELSGKNLYLTKDAFVLGPEGPQPIGKLVKVGLTGKSLKAYLG